MARCCRLSSCPTNVIHCCTHTLLTFLPPTFTPSKLYFPPLLEVLRKAQWPLANQQPLVGLRHLLRRGLISGSMPWAEQAHHKLMWTSDRRRTHHVMCT